MADAAITKNLISLSAQVTRDVTQDFTAITFTTIQGASTPGKVRENLNIFLSEALAQAKAIEDVEGETILVETGTYSINPQYDKKGQITSYQGTAELIVSGTDTTKMAALTGEIKGMMVTDVTHSVSRKLRESLEAEMADEVILAFRQKALDYTQSFGFKSFSIVNANVNVGLQNYRPRGGGMRVASMAYAASAESVMPDAAGKDSITAQVSGSILLK